jgi:hypothetical protein
MEGAKGKRHKKKREKVGKKRGVKKGRIII